MRIPEETVSLIQERADILEVVGDFVDLKKKGSNWMACCPFHDEKSPSFSVSPAKGIYKCFGCGRGGDSVRFVMEHESYTFPEALRYLANKYQIKIEEEKDLSEEEKAQRTQRESLLILHEAARDFFQKQLLESTEGKTVGLSYFKERGFDTETIQTFQLGYSPKQKDAFAQIALQKKYAPELLEKSGIVSQPRPKQWYDRFRERVMFPIHNVSGRVIGFGGRILRKDKKAAKYLNSPETPIYHKSQVLYGLFQAKNSIRQADNCYLVEGYTDVISLHQHGVKNVVSSSGTSLTSEQIRLIRRFTPNITVLYDGDAAGLKASLRGIDLILEADMNVRAVVFPEGEDPDSYVQKVGSQAFQEYLDKQSQDFISFKTDIYQKEAQNDPLKRAEMIREIVRSIMKIPDEIKKTVYIQECSRKLGIAENVLLMEGTQIIQSPRSKTPPKNPSFVAKSERAELIDPKKEADPSQSLQEEAALERETIRLLLNYGENELPGQGAMYGYLVKEMQGIEFKHPVLKTMWEVICQQAKSNQAPPVNQFVKSSDPELQKMAVDLIADIYQLSPRWEEKYLIENPTEERRLPLLVEENVLRHKLQHIFRLLQENEERLMQTEDAHEQDKCLKVALKLEAIRKEIAGKLNIVILKK